MSRTLAVLVLTGAALSACADDTDATPEYLFVLDAPSGEIVSVDGGFELVVPADQGITWFTDRPFRQAGNLSLEQLSADWEDDGYVAQPPQAALDVYIDGRDETYVVELGTPRLEGELFHIPLDDVLVEDTSTAEHAGRAATLDVVAGRHEEISMFISSTRTCSACQEASS